MRTAFIGLGNMGLGMALNLVKAGFETTVFDVRPEVVEVVVAAGATAADSAADAARGADLVCVAVFDEAQVRAVVGGAGSDGGVLGAVPAGAVVTIHSTISPGLVKELAATGAERGVDVLDVAMTGGGDVAAAAGSLTFMVGGPDDAVARVRPALNAMARHIHHVGPTGAGVSAKIINNFLTQSNIALVREALRIAAGANLDESVILGIVQDGEIGSSWASNNWQRIRAQQEDYTTGKQGMVAMWSKDLMLARTLAATNGVSAPIAECIYTEVLPAASTGGLTD